MSLDFASNIIAPPRPRCIGVAMQPYCLGHHLRLTAAESPFVTGKGFPGYEDLILAALICAHTWDEGEQLLRSRWRMWFTLKVWGFFAGNFDVLESLAAMAKHVRESLQIPETKTQKKGSVRHLFSDWETRLYTFLRSHGLSHVEAMNTPMTIANLMFCAHMEETGGMEFKSKLDYDIDDALTRACDEGELAERSMPA